jgi:hypothetical protein
MAGYQELPAVGLEKRPANFPRHAKRERDTQRCGKETCVGQPMVSGSQT